MNWLHLFAFPFLLSLSLSPLMNRAALKFKILDYPHPRKIHPQPIPLLGGVAIYLGFAVTLLANFQFSLPLKGVLLGATLITAIGLIDDIRPLPATLRLIGQLLAAGILIRYGVKVSFLPNTLWGEIGEVVITIVWVVGITNALNFLDGLDGLATGLSAIAAGVFFVIALQTNQPYLGYLTVALLGTTLGFLPYNWHPARMFLGDSGSSFLGFSLAGLAIMGGWAENNPIVALSIPILVLGVLIFDMVYITLSRFKQGKVKGFRSWIEYVGRDHLHHRLLKLGFSQRQTTLFIYLMSLCLGLSAIALASTFNKSALLLLSQAIIIFLIITILMQPLNK